jgi:hypothetical protein
MAKYWLQEAGQVLSSYGTSRPVPPSVLSEDTAIELAALLGIHRRPYPRVLTPSI